MAYEKTEWKGRKGSNLNRFSKEQETARSVILNNKPDSVTQPGTPISVSNMNKIEQGIYDAHEAAAAEAAARQAADNQSNQAIANINEKIPNQASAANQLADKNFTNSSISNMAANYVTPNAAGDAQFASLDALKSGPWYNKGISYTPTKNDYAVFLETDSSIWRASYDGTQWNKSYKVNDTPFTAAQLSAINSNITSSLVQKLINPDTAPIQNSSGLVTSGGVFSWFGASVSTLQTSAKTVVGSINELRAVNISNLAAHNADNSAHENIQQSIANEANERKNEDNNLRNLISNVAEGRNEQCIYQQRDQSVPITVSGVIIGGDDPLSGDYFNVPIGSFITPSSRELREKDLVFITYRHNTEGDILCIAKIVGFGPSVLRTCIFQILSRVDGLTAERLKELSEAIKELDANKLNKADIDTAEPTSSSQDTKVTSAARLWKMFGAALSTLKTTAKTVIGAINELFDSKANTASPTFTGTPRAPTPAASVNDTQIATMAAVHAVANETKSPSSTGFYYTDNYIYTYIGAHDVYDINVTDTARPPRIGDFVFSTNNSVLLKITQVNSISGNTANVRLAIIAELLKGQTPSHSSDLPENIPNLNFLVKRGFYHIIDNGSGNALPDEAEGQYHSVLVVGINDNANTMQILITHTGQMFVRGQSHIQGLPYIKEDWRRLDTPAAQTPSKQYARVDLTDLYVFLSGAISNNARIIAGYLDFTVINNDTLVIQLYFQLEKLLVFTEPGGGTSNDLHIDLDKRNPVIQRAVELIDNASVNPFPGVKYWVPSANVEYINSQKDYRAMPGFIKRSIQYQDNYAALDLNFDRFDGGNFWGGAESDIVAAYDVIINGGL